MSSNNDVKACSLEKICTMFPTPAAPFQLQDLEWGNFEYDRESAELRAPRIKDPLITFLSREFGGFKGKRILELGPYEGFHSVAVHKENPAKVLSIEANPLNYLKCLVVKQYFDLKNVEFRLGDFVWYLADKPQKFDFILALGVLYHVAEPFRVLDLMMDLTDSFGVCTTFYDPGDLVFQFTGKSKQVHYPGIKPYTVFERLNPKGTRGKKHGIDQAAWIFTRDDLYRHLEFRGFDVVEFDCIQTKKSGPRVRLFVQRRKAAAG